MPVELLSEFLARSSFAPSPSKTPRQPLSETFETWSGAIPASSASKIPLPPSGCPKAVNDPILINRKKAVTLINGKPPENRSNRNPNSLLEENECWAETKKGILRKELKPVKVKRVYHAGPSKKFPRLPYRARRTASKRGKRYSAPIKIGKFKRLKKNQCEQVVLFCEMRAVQERLVAVEMQLRNVYRGDAHYLLSGEKSRKVHELYEEKKTLELVIQDHKRNWHGNAKGEPIHVGAWAPHTVAKYFDVDVQVIYNILDHYVKNGKIAFKHYSSSRQEETGTENTFQQDGGASYTRAISPRAEIITCPAMPDVRTEDIQADSRKDPETCFRTPWTLTLEDIYHVTGIKLYRKVKDGGQYQVQSFFRNIKMHTNVETLKLGDLIWQKPSWITEYGSSSSRALDCSLRYITRKTNEFLEFEIILAEKKKIDRTEASNFTPSVYFRTSISDDCPVNYSTYRDKSLEKYRDRLWKEESKKKSNGRICPALELL